jgi:CheY-like chemotaxis protein
MCRAIACLTEREDHLRCQRRLARPRGGHKSAPFFSVINVAVKRILLVEDEPTTREILAEVLRGEGYTVDTVAGVSAANICLRSLAYELVVSDWLLPDGDGVAVADAAAALGFKTLIVSGVISQLPGDAHLRHRLILKSLGAMALVSAAVQAAIGSP